MMAAVVAISASTTGCGVSNPMTSSRNVTQTNVDLSQKNYKVTKTAEGKQGSTYILGIGGLSKKAVKNNSYAEMVKNANLTGSQAIINPTTEIKQRGLFPIYWKVEANTFGQVVEFTE